MDALGPRDPQTARFYGSPRPGFLCGACGRETSTFDAGRREVVNPSGITVIEPRRVCRACLAGILENPGMGTSFDATFHPGEAPAIESIPLDDRPGDDPDGACTGK